MIARTAPLYEQIPSLQEELKQDMAVEAWRALSGFRDQADANTFLYRVIHNVGANHVRYCVRRNAHEGPATDYSDQYEQQASPSAASRARLVSAMFALPVDQRQVIAMKLEGLKNQQISVITGMSESNVGVILNRAKKRLQQLLEQKDA